MIGVRSPLPSSSFPNGASPRNRLGRILRQAVRSLSSASVGGAFALVSLLWCAACAADSAAPALTVLAAASTTPIGPPLAQAWANPELEVHYRWGSSGSLARQAADDAPGDVLLCAHPRWIEWLRAKKALASEPVPFASNRLVAVVPKSAGANMAATHLGELVAALQPGERLGIGDAGVPLGDYTRQALQHAQADESARPFLVALPDARAVLRAAEQGQVRAAIVYRSDALQSSAKVLFEIPSEAHDPIRYWACVLAAAQHPEAAQSYLEFLRSDKARSILERFAFQ